MALWDFEGRRPRLGRGAYVHPAAHVVGRVQLGEDASVWFGAVLRGDVCRIEVGEATNIQDNAVLHVRSSGLPCLVGEQVTVGHGAVLHACTIGSATLIGMGAVVLDGAEVEGECIVAAGSLLAPGQRIPSGSLAMGRPARVKRPLRPEEIDEIYRSSARYVELKRRYEAQEQER